MSESAIKSDIMKFLNRLPGAYFRLIQVGQIPGRTNRSKGISDIIGVHKGVPYAIEVKTPTGKISVEQAEFLRCWARAGGVALVPRSLKDVMDYFLKEAA